MEWRRKPGTDPADPHGVADLLARACEDVSTSAVEGTRFLFTTEEMVRVSRTIEQAAMVDPSTPLYVGVQHAHRLELQADVYDVLVGAGVDVHAFGVDDGPALPGVRWTTVPADPYELAAQWFLVRGGDDPQALVGFELAPITPGGPRRWEGFETHDRLLVEAIIEHLRHMQGGPSAAPGPLVAGGVAGGRRADQR
jgi:hypothetical protein